MIYLMAQILPARLLRLALPDFIRRCPLVFIFMMLAGAPQAGAYADSSGNNLAIFIFGSARTSEFDISFNDARTDLNRVLNANGYFPNQRLIFRETPKRAGSAGSPEFRSDRQTLLKKLAAAAEGGTYDDFFFFLAAHAKGADDQALISLPLKQEIRYSELLGQIKKIKAKRAIFIIAAPQGQVWVRQFSGEDRVIIAGTVRPDVNALPVQFLKNFPRMFEKAARWHGANTPGIKEQSVSLSEVFFLTGLRVKQWYQTNHLAAIEEPVMDSNGDGKAAPAASPLWLAESVRSDELRFLVPWVRKQSVINRERKTTARN